MARPVRVMIVCTDRSAFLLVDSYAEANLQNMILYSPSMGALTSLYGATSTAAADLNGKVSLSHPFEYTDL